MDSPYMAVLPYMEAYYPYMAVIPYMEAYYPYMAVFPWKHLFMAMTAYMETITALNAQIPTSLRNPVRNLYKYAN